VYFEAGFAMGLDIDVVWCCKKDKLDTVHFDVNHYNIIVWETEQDLKDKLEKRIEATFGIGPNL
jgi:hypothetical protein